jgi:hypothetical protein
LLRLSKYTWKILNGLRTEPTNIGNVREKIYQEPGYAI